MAKILPASCVGGVVTAEGVPLVSPVILSEGVHSSTGIAIIDEDKIYYVASNALDLKAEIQAISDMITKIVAIVTAIDAVTLSPGTSTALTAQLVALNVQYTLTKELLR